MMMIIIIMPSLTGILGNLLPFISLSASYTLKQAYLLSRQRSPFGVPKVSIQAIHRNVQQAPSFYRYP